MFLSMTTWVSGINEAIGGVAVAPDSMTVVMAVVAATLTLGAVVIVAEWLQGWFTEQRRGRRRSARRRHRLHWPTRLGEAGHRGT
jgi:hypothetical protein